MGFDGVIRGFQGFQECFGWFHGRFKDFKGIQGVSGEFRSISGVFNGFQGVLQEVFRGVLGALFEGP